jgi:hypothetical protein
MNQDLGPITGNAGMNNEEQARIGDKGKRGCC